MTKPNWIKIKGEYINSNISYRILAEKYGVKYPTLRDRATREKWLELRNKQRDKTMEKTLQKVSDKVSDEESEFIIEFAKLNYQLSKKIFDLANGVSTPQALKQLTSALKDIKDVHTDTPTNKNSDRSIERELSIEELKKLAKENPL